MKKCSPATLLCPVHRSTCLEAWGPTLPAQDNRELAHHRREVRGRAAGRLQVGEPSLAPGIVLVWRSLPRDGLPGQSKAILSIRSHSWMTAPYFSAKRASRY